MSAQLAAAFAPSEYSPRRSVQHAVKPGSPKLSRDLRDAPLERYRVTEQHRPERARKDWRPDGRKWKVSARDRMSLALWLSTFADGDGTRIFPSIARMVAHFGWSRSKLFLLLADLKELGLLVDEGLRWERGPRERRMDLSAFIGAEVQDSGEPKSRIRGAEVHSNDGHRPSPLTDTKIKPKAGVAVENSRPQNPAAQTAASSSLPLSRIENRKRLPQQVEWAHVRRLVAGAVFVYKRAEAAGTQLDYSSWKEDLKRWAAENGIPYDPDSIAKALDNAEREISNRRLAAVAGSRP